MQSERFSRQRRTAVHSLHRYETTIQILNIVLKLRLITALVCFLGVFLTDLVYLDMANSESEPPNLRMDAILTCITYFKKSNYFVLKPELAVQDYLRSLRYIEELQKFHEDDQYK